MVKHDFVTFQRIRYGAVAQLAERVARIHEARGSNPLSSITLISMTALQSKESDNNPDSRPRETF